CHSSPVSLSFFVFFLLLPPPPRSTLFPYTTLFRSCLCRSTRERERDRTGSVYPEALPNGASGGRRRCCRSGVRARTGSPGLALVPERRFEPGFGGRFPG